MDGHVHCYRKHCRHTLQEVGAYHAYIIIDRVQIAIYLSRLPDGFCEVWKVVEVALQRLDLRRRNGCDLVPHSLSTQPQQAGTRLFQYCHATKAMTFN